MTARAAYARVRGLADDYARIALNLIKTVYEREGSWAAQTAARTAGVTDIGYCKPCEDDVPVLDGVCVVCWSKIEKGKVKHAKG